MPIINMAHSREWLIILVTFAARKSINASGIAPGIEGFSPSESQKGTLMVLFRAISLEYNT